MTVYDLNRDQLVELKQRYLTEEFSARGEEPSYADLADADNIISDEEIYTEYNGTDFSMDDFFSTAGQEEIKNTFIISDGGLRFLHAVSSIEYQWSDWVADTFSKRGAMDALAWARKKGFIHAKAIVVIL